MSKGLRGIDSIIHLISLSLWNQEMQSFYDLISRSDRAWNLVSERDHLNLSSPISSDKLSVAHNMPTVQIHVKPSIIEIS